MTTPQSDIETRVKRGLARDRAALREELDGLRDKLEDARDRYDDAVARESAAWPEVDQGGGTAAWDRAMTDAEEAQTTILWCGREQARIGRKLEQLGSPAEYRRRTEMMERLAELRERGELPTHEAVA